MGVSFVFYSQCILRTLQVLSLTSVLCLDCVPLSNIWALFEVYRGFISPSILQTYMSCKGHALDIPQNAQLLGAHKTVAECMKGYCSFLSLLLQPQT